MPVVVITEGTLTAPATSATATSPAPKTMLQVDPQLTSLSCIQSQLPRERARSAGKYITPGGQTQRENRERVSANNAPLASLGLYSNEAATVTERLVGGYRMRFSFSAVAAL